MTYSVLLKQNFFSDFLIGKIGFPLYSDLYGTFPNYATRSESENNNSPNFVFSDWQKFPLDVIQLILSLNTHASEHCWGLG
jgi:hypothetical protein